MAGRGEAWEEEQLCESETKVWAQKWILTCHLQLQDRAWSPLT